MRYLDWFLARRYLSSRRGGPLLSFITWIALGGVIVGVTALVVVIGVMTGMQEDLRGAILASNPHVLVLQTGDGAVALDDWEAVAEKISGVEGVSAVAPFVLSNTIVKRAGAQYQQPAALYGIRLTTDTSSAPTDLERDVARGVYDLGPTESGLPPIIVGGRLAGRMQVYPGDTVEVWTFENLRPSAVGGLLPTTRTFEVTGRFTTGMYDVDIKNLYTSLEAAQDLMDFPPDRVGGLAVRTENADLAGPVADAIQDTLGFDYVAQSWTVSNQALFSALELEKLAMFVILFLIVVVAAFNIISTLIMVVHDRTREIGILKSMGMTDDGILRVFVIQGAWIGIMGTAIGTGLGLLLCWIIDTFDIIRIPPQVYFVDRLPVKIDPFDILWIVAGSIAIAFLATIYPARQAARLQPVEAIRSE